MGTALVYTVLCSIIYGKWRISTAKCYNLFMYQLWPTPGRLALTKYMYNARLNREGEHASCCYVARFQKEHVLGCWAQPTLFWVQG